jgi:rhodanese-related sulfurtransferase
MATTAKQLVDAANAVVPKISGQEAQEMVAKGAVLVDIRDSAELSQTGKAAGAVHIPRGSLEFKADLSSPSGAALAGKLLKEMGYEKVYNLGGFKDWVEAGGKVEK